MTFMETGSGKPQNAFAKQHRSIMPHVVWLQDFGHQLNSSTYNIINKLCWRAGEMCLQRDSLLASLLQCIVLFVNLNCKLWIFPLILISEELSAGWPNKLGLGLLSASASAHPAQGQLPRPPTVLVLPARRRPPRPPASHTDSLVYYINSTSR